MLSARYVPISALSAGDRAGGTTASACGPAKESHGEPGSEGSDRDPPAGMRAAKPEQARPGLRGAVYRAACGRPSGPRTPVQRPAGTEGASQTSVFQAPARHGQWTRWRPDSDLAWERGHRGGGPEEASVAGAERAGVGELRKAAVAVALVWRPTMNVRT